MSAIENLKTLPELLVADPRFAAMMEVGAEPGEPRPHSLEQHYARYAMLRWPRGAPVEIVNGFVTAQHLAIYAWFSFAFSTLAGMQALITLEHALRRRMQNEAVPGMTWGRSGFKARLRHAIESGWIEGAKLRKLQPFIVAASADEFERRPLDENGAESLQMFLDNLPSDRNWLAHGNWASGNDPFITLELVLQLINQLYP